MTLVVGDKIVAARSAQRLQLQLRLLDDTEQGLARCGQ